MYNPSSNSIKKCPSLGLTVATTSAVGSPNTKALSCSSLRIPSTLMSWEKTRGVLNILRGYLSRIPQMEYISYGAILKRQHPRHLMLNRPVINYHSLIEGVPYNLDFFLFPDPYPQITAAPIAFSL